jgi:hypothetical protein
MLSSSLSSILACSSKIAISCSFDMGATHGQPRGGAYQCPGKPHLQGWQYPCQCHILFHLLTKFHLLVLPPGIHVWHKPSPTKPAASASTPASSPATIPRPHWVRYADVGIRIGIRVCIGRHIDPSGRSHSKWHVAHLLSDPPSAFSDNRRWHSGQ